jgi:hypothetical protein
MKFPIRIEVLTFRSLPNGDAVDYEGDLIKGDFSRTVYTVDSFDKEIELYENIANPSVFRRINKF